MPSEIASELPSAATKAKSQTNRIINETITSIRNASRQFELATEYVLLSEEDEAAVEEVSDEIERRYKIADTILSINLYIGIASFIVPFYSRVVPEQFSEVYQILEFIANRAGNIIMCGLPLGVGLLLDKKITLPEDETIQSLVNLNPEQIKLLRKLIETMIYLLPFITAAILFAYNIDVETSQSLPYFIDFGPGDTGKAGTPDLLDIPAGIWGLLSSLLILIAYRKRNALVTLQTQSSYIKQMEYR